MKHTVHQLVYIKRALMNGATDNVFSYCSIRKEMESRRSTDSNSLKFKELISSVYNLYDSLKPVILGTKAYLGCSRTQYSFERTWSVVHHRTV